MSRSPAFQFYPGDFLAGRVAMYSLEEIGAYMVLLASDWTLNGLPTDVEKLAKLCRVSRRRFAGIWQNISDQFEEHEGKLRNPRLVKERERQELWREKSSEGGKKSAKGRTKGGSTVVEPTAQPKGNTSSSSSSSSSTSVTTKRTTVPPRAASTATVVEASNLQRFPKATADAGYERWVKKIGAMNYGAFRKAIQPVYDAQPGVYSGEQLVLAVDAFHEAMKGDDVRWRDKWTERKFARELHHWVKLGAMELVDEWGAPTERGRASGLFSGAQ